MSSNLTAVVLDFWPKSIFCVRTRDLLCAVLRSLSSNFERERIQDTQQIMGLIPAVRNKSQYLLNTLIGAAVNSALVISIERERERERVRESMVRCCLQRIDCIV